MPGFGMERVKLKMPILIAAGLALSACDQSAEPAQIEGCILRTEDAVIDLREVLGFDRNGSSEVTELLMSGAWTSVWLSVADRDRVELAWQQCVGLKGS